MPHPFKVQSLLGGITTDARLSVITATDPGGLFAQQNIRYTILDPDTSPPTPQPPLPAVPNDLDNTYDPGNNDSGWVDEERFTVNGWDWSMPPNSFPEPLSGIFMNSGSSVPNYYQGNHLLKLNAHWKFLEPTEGNYDFSIIEDGLDDNNFDGVMLNVRGMVVKIEDANTGADRFPVEWSSPPWLQNPVYREDERNGSIITNLRMNDNDVDTKFRQLIVALGNAGFHNNPKLIGQIIHGSSESRGEEWGGRNGGASEDEMESWIIAWANAYGSNAKKLAWLKENPRRLFDASVGNGCGLRGGSAENWLRNQYTGGNVDETGQTWNGNDGHLTTDEDFIIIQEGRHWADQNEAYRSGSQDPQSTWPQNYMQANLRGAQMRRNIWWADQNFDIDARNDNWLSLQLGKTPANSKSAWVRLMRTYSRGRRIPPDSFSTGEVNNFERHLYQREFNGNTTPVLNRLHGTNAEPRNVSASAALETNLWNISYGRRGSHIGLAVDPLWMQGGPHDVYIRVVWFDNSPNEWHLDYQRSGGGTGRFSRKGQNDDTLRSTKFHITDFSAPELAQFDEDFSINSDGVHPFLFVEIIKA